MIVKLSTGIKDYKFIRQTPGNLGTWQDYKFVENEKIQNCDFFFVYNNVQEIERVFCKSGIVTLITAEPASNLIYNKKFLKQFDYVVTCQREIKHNKPIFRQQALPWHIGISKANNIAHNINRVTLDFDKLVNIDNFEKHKLISVITSSKRISPGHIKRIGFVESLKTHFGKKLDVFGAGLNHIEDKWNAIAPYKYHISIENSSYLDYWTEKLSDTYLAGAFPIYYGCPNIHNYFEKDALLNIDINKPKESIKLIEKAINEDLYLKRLDKINEARTNILYKYNLFPFIIETIKNDLLIKRPRKIEILPHEYFLHKPPKITQRTISKIKSLIKEAL